MALGSANPLLLATAASGGDSDPVTRSLRYPSGSYQSFTPSSDSSDFKKWVFSCWVKRCTTGVTFPLFQTASGTSVPYNITTIHFDANDILEVGKYTNSYQFRRNTTRVFRDPSAWMCVTVVYDSTESNEVDRIKIYINGEHDTNQTSLTNVDLNEASTFGTSGQVMRLNSFVHSAGNDQGKSYQADVYFIDGSVTLPTGYSDWGSVFAEDTGYGSVKPRDTSSILSSSDFGTNGFHLKLDDSSDIGADDAGSNDFTATNLSSHDVMLDTPTANYPVLNVLDKDAHHGLATEGNLLWKPTNSSGTVTYDDYAAAISSTIQIPSTGKWYFEFRVSSVGTGHRGGISITNDQTALQGRFGPTGGWNTGGVPDNQVHVHVDAYSGGFVAVNARASGSDNSTTHESLGTGDYIMSVAIDSGAKKLWARRDGGSWYSSGDPSNGTNPNATWTLDYSRILVETCTNTATTASSVVRMNFGADPTFQGTYSTTPATSEFAFDPPTNFVALNTSNFDTPPVTPSENFNTVLYTGDGNTNHDITGVGFESALTWIKSRSSRWHQWYDAARGAGKVVHSNSSNSESDNTAYFGPFQSDGFRLAPTTSGTGENASGENYVAWNWKAHQTPAASYNYNNTLTLSVEAYDQGYGSFSGWGTTKLEVIEGSTSLGFVSEPTTYDNDYGGYYVQYSIKTDDVSKIKLVWRTVDSDSDVFYDIYAYLENSSSTELASWDGYNYYGGGGEGDDAPETDDVFYPSSGHDSTNASTTGVLEVQATSSSSEKYNASAGFTIISYSGDGASDGDDQTLDHSLGVPLEFVIAKGRTNNDSMDNGNWVVYHKDLTSGDYLTLNSNSASDTPYNEYKLIEPYVSGSQHSVVVSNDTDSAGTDYLYLNSGPDNGVGEDYILYGWAGVEGYSKFGKYTGNGSTDGPFIYTGFRPAFVLWKRATGSSNSWNIMDNKREGYNPQNDLLFPDSSTSESNVTDQELLSNGFKLRTSGAGRNANNETFIYAAFAESPFKHANAR